MIAELHPAFAAIIVVAALVSLGVPRTRLEILESVKVGMIWAVASIVMNAVFQWSDPSPVNLLLMNERAGTFECLLMSISYAFLLRGGVGSVWCIIQRIRSKAGLP